MAPGVAPFVAAATGGARPHQRRDSGRRRRMGNRRASHRPTRCLARSRGGPLVSHYEAAGWRMEQPATNRRGRAPPSNLRPTSVSKQIILRPTRGPPPFLFLSLSPFLFTCISPLSLTHKHRRHIISLARPHRQQFVPPTDVCYNSLHFTAAPMKQQLPLIERHTFDHAFNSISLKNGQNSIHHIGQEAK